MKKVASITLIVILSITIGIWISSRDKRQEQLEKFYEITKNDPLFYDSTLETEKFDAAIGNLKSKEDEFLKFHSIFLKEEDKKVFPRNWRLFPIDFLKQVSDVAIQTDLFLAKPAFLEAYRLLRAYKHTASAYRHNAELQLTVIDNILEQRPKLANRLIRFFGSGTTLNIIRNDFLLIQQNAEALNQEIESREKCLFYGECNLKNTNSPEKLRYLDSIPYTLNPNSYNLLPIDILAPYPDYDEVLGPYFAETGCWGFNQDSTPKTQAFYLFKKDGKFFPKLATENYYLDYEYWEGRWDTASIFIQKGIQYDTQPETADYRCPDLTYWAELFNNEFRVLPHFINSTARFLSFLTLEQQIQEKASGALYLMTTRTDHSIFFLPFANSVWRIEETPQYLINKSVPLSEGFETYSSLKEKGYSEAEIKKFDSDPIPLLRSFVSLIDSSQKNLFLGFWESIYKFNF